jgi:hypothetical protein
VNTADRQKTNAARLQKIDYALRPKVRAVISDLEGHNWQPLIDASVWRSPAQQLEKFNKGYSKVKWSYHNATTPDGKAAALAADITDARWGWDSPRAFWLQLAASARAHNLHSGIYFGLSKAQRAALDVVISSRDFENRRVATGWDEAHVEVRGISLLAARLGKRPKLA